MAVVKAARPASTAFRSIPATEAFIKIPSTNEVALLIILEINLSVSTVPAVPGSGDELFPGCGNEVGVPDLEVSVETCEDGTGAGSVVDSPGKVGRIRVGVGRLSVGSSPRGSKGLNNLLTFESFDEEMNPCLSNVSFVELADVSLN